MKLYGIIIDHKQKDHIRKFGNWPLEYDHDMNDYDFLHSEDHIEFEEIIDDRIEGLEDQTNYLMIGNNGTKLFIFSDKEKGYKYIKYMFPSFELCEISDDKVVWDHDYRKET